jgi:hypothetical protein
MNKKPAKKVMGEESSESESSSSLFLSSEEAEDERERDPRYSYDSESLCTPKGLRLFKTKIEELIQYYEDQAIQQTFSIALCRQREGSILNCLPKDVIIYMHLFIRQTQLFETKEDEGGLGFFPVSEKLEFCDTYIKFEVT